MEKIGQVARALFFIAYVFGLFYLALENAYISDMVGIPKYILPSLCLVGLIFICYRYIYSYVRMDKLEYEFTSVVNHTFRTPLTRIMWYAKELEKDLSHNERMLYVQNMTNAANRVLEIVDLYAGIKNINDTAGYFFEATSLRDIVERTIVKYREEINKHEVSFQVSTFKDVPLLTLDLKKITFVIDTLIENAILYTPKGGKVLIDSISDGKKLTFYVSDNGMGLTWMDKMRVFKRFYRSKKAVLMNPDGTGLKLYLAKKIIKRHKGKIYAKSAGPEKGAVFFVELPLNRR